MKIHVCSKLSIPAINRFLPSWEYLRSLGHDVLVSDGPVATDPPDVIIGMGIGVLEATDWMVRRFPSALFFAYNWDCYAWVWDNPRQGEYDYHRYGRLLGITEEVWVPSDCTGFRTAEWWGLENWHTITSCCPYWEYANVRDDGYALCTLREIPDPSWGRLESACKQLGIPLIMTRHEQDYEAYKDAVAGCRFIVSHLDELSTGGLSLLEAYYHGKPVLLSNSPWNGGADYFGNWAEYFQHDNDTDFADKLLNIYHNPMDYVHLDQRQRILNNHTDELMQSRMLQRIEKYA